MRYLTSPPDAANPRGKTKKKGKGKGNMESSADDSTSEIRPDIEKVEEKLQEEEEALPARNLHGFKVPYLDSRGN